MPQIYFESKSLENLTDKELYFKFKIIEKRNNAATSAKIPYEMKMELDRLYESYLNEIDNRISSGKLSYEDVDDWDDFYYEHENDFLQLSSNNQLTDENIKKIK